MKKLKLLWRILKTTEADKIIFGFLGFVLVSALIFTLVEPNIKSYGNGVWYSFAVFTTIGFGDVVAITLIGRIVTILLGLYGILIVALIPGIIVNYYTEINRIKCNNSIMEFFDKLERLTELSKEELEEISATACKHKYKL